MPNDYKDICRSIEKLEKAISRLPKEFKDNKDVVRMLEKQLREFQKSNKFEIQKENRKLQTVSANINFICNKHCNIFNRVI